MNTKLDLFLDIQMENKTNDEIAKYLSLNNKQNIKFTFVQFTEGKFEFYVEGSSRNKIDQGLKELGFKKSSKFYENL